MVREVKRGVREAGDFFMAGKLVCSDLVGFTRIPLGFAWNPHRKQKAEIASQLPAKAGSGNTMTGTNGRDADATMLGPAACHCFRSDPVDAIRRHGEEHGTGEGGARVSG